MATPGPGIYHPRRYYLLKAQAAELEESGLREVWWAKQASARAAAIPEDFPHRAALAAIRYTTWHDLDGATVEELVAAGLDRRTATAVITLRGTKMGYQMANGQWADTDDVALAASAARTAGANGSAVELGDAGVLRLLLDVTAASGTAPTLDVTIETSHNGTDSWRPIGSFPQLAASGASRKSFTGVDRFVRAGWAIGGTTPSFTFSIAGEGV